MTNEQIERAAKLAGKLTAWVTLAALAGLSSLVIDLVAHDELLGAGLLLFAFALGGAATWLLS